MSIVPIIVNRVFSLEKKNVCEYNSPFNLMFCAVCDSFCPYSFNLKLKVSIVPLHR